MAQIDWVINNKQSNCQYWRYCIVLKYVLKCKKTIEIYLKSILKNNIYQIQRYLSNIECVIHKGGQFMGFIFLILSEYLLNKLSLYLNNLEFVSIQYFQYWLEVSGKKWSFLDDWNDFLDYVYLWWLQYRTNNARKLPLNIKVSFQAFNHTYFNKFFWIARVLWLMIAIPEKSANFNTIVGLQSLS